MSENLGRFDHHPDPAIDFCIEVEAIEAYYFDATHGIGKPGEPVRQIDDAFCHRVEAAMQFRVGGDLNAIMAKADLRKIDAQLRLASRGKPMEGNGMTDTAQDNDAVMPCPICAEPFKPDDLCASDIEMGTCHAACLDGSPVVDLDTGEETGGKVDTYPYSEVAEPDITGGRDDA